MFLASNPFDAVRARKDLNGLEKMRLAIRMNLESTERMALNRQAMPALKNSRVLAQMIETNRTVLTPLWRELIEEGNRDGSVHTQYAQELAELLPLLSDSVLAPTIFPASAQQTARKFDLLAQMLQCMGLPLFDDGLLAMAQGFFAACGAAALRGIARCAPTPPGRGASPAAFISVAGRRFAFPAVLCLPDGTLPFPRRFALPAALLSFRRCSAFPGIREWIISSQNTFIPNVCLLRWR